MKLVVAFLAAALSLSVPLAGAHRPLADEMGPRANLTEIDL